MAVAAADTALRALRRWQTAHVEWQSLRPAYIPLPPYTLQAGVGLARTELSSLEDPLTHTPAPCSGTSTLPPRTALLNRGACGVEQGLDAAGSVAAQRRPSYDDAQPGPKDQQHQHQAEVAVAPDGSPQALHCGLHNLAFRWVGHLMMLLL